MLFKRDISFPLQPNKYFLNDTSHPSVDSLIPLASKIIDTSGLLNRSLNLNAPSSSLYVPRNDFSSILSNEMNRFNSPNEFKSSSSSVGTEVLINIDPIKNWYQKYRIN